MNLKPMTETTRMRAAATGMRLLAFAVIGTAIAACSMLEGDGVPVTAHAPSPAPAEIQPRTIPVPVSPGDRSRIVRPDPATRGNSTAQAAGDIATLIGHNEATVLSRLGEPALRQDEPPARVWQYAGRACAVDLVFFFDMESGEHRLALFRPAGPAASAVEMPAAKDRCPHESLAQLDRRS